MLLCAVVLSVLCTLLTGLFLVSIAWTHRPDLSIVEIIKEAVRELIRTIVKAVRYSGGGKESEKSL